jgi:hypothetical protein
MLFQPSLRRGDGVARSRKPRARNSAISHCLLLEALESRTLLSAYYVSALGSDGGAGSAVDPWQTLQKAANTVTAGDVVTVSPGTYAGFNLTSSHSGTAADPIVFNAQPGVVINTPGPNAPDGINIEGASYVTIDGFTINNDLGQITRGGIRSVTNHNITIRNNTVDGAEDWNIFTGFTDDVLIENNTVTNAKTQHGIYVSNSGDRPVIRGNISYGNHNCGIHMNGDVSQGGDGIISNALVEDNTIYDNGVGGGSGINADGVQDSVFRNNLIYNNHASGISLFKMDGAAPSTGNLVVNNTIVMAPDGRWCVNITDGSVNNTVMNNILDNRNTGRGAITVAADSLTGLKSDFNVIINDRFLNGSSNMTLSQWQASTGQDANSIVSTEPETFVDAAANDYHLFDGSSAVDAGTTDNAPVSGLEGHLRPSGKGVDVGAFEFQVQPSQHVPLAGDADGDGAVGFSDFVVISNNYGATGATAATGDLNGDGIVDFADFVLLSNNYGKTAS